MLEHELQKQLIDTGRAFMKFSSEDEYDDFESDQELKHPQPPLIKANMRDTAQTIDLLRDFSSLNIKKDLVELLTERKSSRVYTGEPMSIPQLSFLLWSTQGVRMFVENPMQPCVQFLRVGRGTDLKHICLL